MRRFAYGLSIVVSLLMIGVGTVAATPVWSNDVTVQDINATENNHVWLTLAANVNCGNSGNNTNSLFLGESVGGTTIMSATAKSEMLRVLLSGWLAGRTMNIRHDWVNSTCVVSRVAIR